MALDEFAGLFVHGAADLMNEAELLQQVDPRALVTEKSDFIVYLKLPIPLNKDELSSRMFSLRSRKLFKQACPVFYTSPDKVPGSRLVLTGDIIVQFPPAYTQEQIAAVENEYGLQHLKTFDFALNTFLYQGADPLTSLDVANRILPTRLRSVCRIDNRERSVYIAG